MEVGVRKLRSSSRGRFPREPRRECLEEGTSVSRIVCIAGVVFGILAIGADSPREDEPRQKTPLRQEDRLGEGAGAVRPALVPVDNGGRRLESLEVGSSLLVRAGGLEPNRTY